jgi:arsenite methyltransferase
MKTDSEIKNAVKETYSEIAMGKKCCTADLSQRCRNGAYTQEEMAALPPGALLGLGCGNPARLLRLEQGMTVLDLGSGAGGDAFLAARKVGPEGFVIGVDMTEAMIERARANAEAGGYGNVQFRLGDIENLPVDDSSIDVIVSNCVINLAPDKGRVFAEAYRVLKPGGRLQVSDVVTRGEAPAHIRESVENWTGCIAGALDRNVYLNHLRAAGFSGVEVVEEWEYDAYRTKDFAALSITVSAVK